jgi:hypothetical protein
MEYGFTEFLWKHLVSIWFASSMRTIAWLFDCRLRMSSLGMSSLRHFIAFVLGQKGFWLTLLLLNAFFSWSVTCCAYTNSIPMLDPFVTEIHAEIKLFFVSPSLNGGYQEGSKATVVLGVVGYLGCPKAKSEKGRSPN